ncbi:Uncharacterized protein APZ42_025814 [Daphnia magna]|uniref:Uncharacterized protein n=1 Tax=Daphnia magna TaxID=35525 RepID=A0A164SQR7_9CRUS|nr:Uncharacterized protein APZ42_025814 [Daphnia magna]
MRLKHLSLSFEEVSHYSPVSRGFFLQQEICQTIMIRGERFLVPSKTKKPLASFIVGLP